MDDEPRIRRFVRVALERNGWSMTEAATGGAAVYCARDTLPDCVLLDLMLPDIDGFEVIRRLRDFSSALIILLTGRDNEEDRVRGLDLGADDYVVKPFGVRELMARIRASLRRAAARPRQPETFVHRDLAVDFAMHRATLHDERLGLTPTEFALLAQLALHNGEVLRPTQLLHAVWGPSYGDDVGLLRTAIWRLRRKLEPDPDSPSYVITVPRVGYTLGPAAD